MTVIVIIVETIYRELTMCFKYITMHLCNTLPKTELWLSFYRQKKKWSFLNISTVNTTRKWWAKTLNVSLSDTDVHCAYLLVKSYTINKCRRLADRKTKMSSVPLSKL